MPDATLLTHAFEYAGGGGGPFVSRQFSYMYDDANGTYKRLGPAQQETMIQLNEAGRVTSVHRYTLNQQQPPQPDQTILYAEYEYHANGQLACASFGNGAATEYEYDAGERV